MDIIISIVLIGGTLLFIWMFLGGVVLAIKEEVCDPFKEMAEKRNYKKEKKRQEVLDEQYRKQRQIDDEKARIAAEQANRERAIIQRQIDRIKAVGEVAGLVSSAQKGAAQLPIILGRAEAALDHAERELADNVPSSFWEAMETAARYLSDFSITMQDIDSARRRHASLAPPLKPDAIDFTLGVSILPDASHTGNRMNNLYRSAQKAKEGNFAVIYEQRRNTATLIQGFRSLGEAFSEMGSRLEAALDSLGNQLEFRLGDIESALRNSAECMSSQQTALLESAEASRREAAQSGTELATIARAAAVQAESEARTRKEHEAEARRMLDNIQRRRYPIPPGIRDGEY